MAGLLVLGQPHRGPDVPLDQAHFRELGQDTGRAPGSRLAAKFSNLLPDPLHRSTQGFARPHICGLRRSSRVTLPGTGPEFHGSVQEGDRDTLAGPLAGTLDAADQQL